MLRLELEILFLKLLKFLLYVYTFLGLSVRLCTMCSAWYPQRSEEGVRSLGTGVRVDCEPHHVGAGNGTWLIWKSSQRVSC